MIRKMAARAKQFIGESRPSFLVPLSVVLSGSWVSEWEQLQSTLSLLCLYVKLQHTHIKKVHADFRAGNKRSEYPATFREF